MIMRKDKFEEIGGLKSSMGYLGSKNIIGLRNKPHFVKYRMTTKESQYLT